MPKRPHPPKPAPLATEEAPPLLADIDLPRRRYGRNTLTFVRTSPAPVLPAEDGPVKENRARYDTDEIDQT